MSRRSAAIAAVRAPTEPTRRLGRITLNTISVNEVNDAVDKLQDKLDAQRDELVSLKNRVDQLWEARAWWKSSIPVAMVALGVSIVAQLKGCF